MEEAMNSNKNKIKNYTNNVFYPRLQEEFNIVESILKVGIYLKNNEDTRKSTKYQKNIYIRMKTFNYICKSFLWTKL